MRDPRGLPLQFSLRRPCVWGQRRLICGRGDCAGGLASEYEVMNGGDRPANIHIFSADDYNSCAALVNTIERNRIWRIANMHFIRHVNGRKADFYWYQLSES